MMTDGAQISGPSHLLMGMFVDLLASLQQRVQELVSRESSLGGQLGLQITMAFKDAQLKLLEETKKVSSLEFCTSLKQSFSTRNQQQKVARHAMTFGAEK